jgi:putative aldouronate transport system substrate-binding protein
MEKTMSSKFNHVSRRSFLKLTGASLATGLVAACGGAATTQAPQATTAPKVEAPKATEAPTQAPAAAAVELKYFYGTRANFKDVSLVQDEMNKILKDKIGATIQLNPLDWSALSDKMQLKNASGEKYDMAFTSSWANPYYPNVKNGVLADLTDVLPNGAPNYWKQIQPGAWNAAKVKGKLYAAINQQTWTPNFGAGAPKSLADKYKLDWTKVNTLNDLESYWDAIKKGEAADVKAIECNDGGGGSVWDVYYHAETVGYGLLDMEEKTPKIVHQWDYAGWVDTMKAVRKWNVAGYYGKEPWPQADAEAKHRAGKGATVLHNMKPGGDLEMKQITGFDWTTKIISKNFLNTGGIIATMIGVSKQSTSVDACVKYFEAINTDKPLYNLLSYGIEGKHWVWTNKDKGVIGLPDGVTAENSGYNPNADWEYGNQFNAYYTDAAKVGAWEATAKLNNEATVSPVMGFVFDQEPVKTELAQIAAVTKEYTLMGIGFIDFDAKLPEYTKRVKDAGGDKVLAEINKQLDAWRQS